MPTLRLTKEQATLLLDAVESKMTDLNEYLPSAQAQADYRGDETGLEELQIALNHLKAIATLLDHQLNWESESQKPD